MLLVLFEFFVHMLECMTSMMKKKGRRGDAVVDEGESSGRQRELSNNLRKEEFDVGGRKRGIKITGKSIRISHH